MKGLKHKKVVRHDLEQPQPTVPGNAEPLRIYINSDGNIIELVSHQQNIRTFKYIQSNTKLGKQITMTDIEYEKFLRNNAMLPKSIFVPYVQKIK